MADDDAISVTTDAHENSYLENVNRRLGPDLNPKMVKQYENRFNNRRQSPKCLKEMELIALSNEIRRKCDWQNKVNDDVITAKWIGEATAGGTREIDIKYAIAELQLLASEYKDTAAKFKFQPSPVDTVYQAEADIFPEGVLEELQALGSRLEAEEEVDWHPGSDGLVRDLVHPSLYPFIHGVSQIVASRQHELNSAHAKGDADGSADEGGALAAGEWQSPVADAAAKKWLSPYQWMPCEVVVDDGGKVTIDSYINNLHPERYRKEYGTIAKVIESLLPMFELTSAQIKESALRNRLNLGGDWWESEDAFCKRMGLEEMTYEDDDYDDFWENYQDTRLLQPINPPECPTLNFKPATSGSSLKGKNLQVIVKLANIHLTPEKPCYKGGSWHIEGEIQENIVASAIVYYEMDNISESELSFRASLDEEFYEYEQCDYRGVELVYGFKEVEDGYQEYVHTQELGSVVAKEGRSIVFSNDLQHRVRPFELSDKTRPGHRKILALFLVDPDARVVSTKDVGFQQDNWMHAQLSNLPAYESMPPEIISNILLLTPGVLTDAQAKRHRKELMKARSMSGMASTIGEGFRLAYSLCEH